MELLFMQKYLYTNIIAENIHEGKKLKHGQIGEGDSKSVLV